MLKLIDKPDGRDDVAEEGHPVAVAALQAVPDRALGRAPRMVGQQGRLAVARLGRDEAQAR